jgi:hypothetical protein
MRNVLATLFAASAATLGLAQSPLTTAFAGGNSGNVGGGLYFDLQILTTVTLTQIDINSTLAAGTALNFEVHLGPTTYVGNTASAALWAPVATASGTLSGLGVPSVGVLTPIAPLTDITLAPGNYGVALRALGHDWAYTNGVTCTSTTVPGSCANSLFNRTEMILRAGAAQNAFLTGGVFSPRIINCNIHYTPPVGNPIAVASQQKYGDGCYGRWTSFYEHTPNPIGLDIGNVPANPSGVTTITFGFAGATYNVSAGGTAFTPPTTPPIVLANGNTIFTATSALGAALPVTILYPSAGAVGFANDLDISPDGYILPTTGTLNDNTPTVAEFLAGAARWAPLWKNLDPILGGSMHIEVEAGTGALVVTWNAVRNDNVLLTGGTTTNSFQVAFYNTGNVEYRFAGMSQEGGGTLPIIMGLTQGAGALDRGNLDISGSLPFSTSTVDNEPLSVELSARPVLGSAPNWIVTGYSQGTSPTNIGARILSFTQFNPGLPLGGLGMPGCFQFVGLDSTAVFFTLGNPTSTFPFIPGGIPNLPAFNGVLVFGQAATFTSGYNPLGVITSNGLRLQLGTL